MRNLVFVVLSFLARPNLADLPSASTKVNDPEHIALLNTAPGRTWVAAPQRFFAGLTFQGAQRFLGAALSNNSRQHHEGVTTNTYPGHLDIPVNFDARAEWPGLIQPIRAQQRCGSCWAFSALDVLSDRIGIKEGFASSALSPADMLGCSKHRDCQSRPLSFAWDHLTRAGVAAESCVPSTDRGATPLQCPSKCREAARLQRMRASSSYAIVGTVNMQKDVMIHGPIQAAFAVYKSFMVYKSGLYQRHWWEAEPEGGHAVRILGWGNKNRKGYWLAANSWGVTWGEKGFFRIFRGASSCGIEELGPPRAGLPAQKEDDFMI